MVRIAPAAGVGEGSRWRRHLEGARRCRLVAICLVVSVVEARFGTDLGVHPEVLLRAQQARNVAVRIVNIAERQRVGDASIDASRGRLRVDAGNQAIVEPEIDPIRAKSAFLRNTNSMRVLAHDFVLHRGPAIGKAGRIDLESCLIGTGNGAIGAADAEVIIDGDDPIGASPRCRRRTHVHARRIVAMLAADGNKAAADVGIAARLDIENSAPLHEWRRGIGLLAGRGAGLASDAALQVCHHHPTCHCASLNRVTLTLTRSALDPVASVRSSSIGMSAFMLGAVKSLANGVAHWSN